MLLLTEGREGLWERYQRDRGAPRLTSIAPVVPRWHRAAELGVRSEGAAHPVAVFGHDLAVRRDAALGGLADGGGVVEALEGEVSARGLVSIVADAQGVIVRARGGAAFAPEVERTRLVEGVRWDEGTRGTNAIGTALAERQPIAVVGRAHWESVNHGLFCYASPVLDPFGELVAVIDVTGPIDLDSPALGVAVRSAAAAMEQVLRTRAYGRTDAGSRRLVERMMERTSSAVVLVEAPGVVRAHNRAATAELGLERGVDAPVERLFGIEWPELVRVALGGPASFETRRRRFTVEFEPIVAEGRVLALVCYFGVVATHRGRAIPEDTPLPRAFDRIFATDADVIAAKRLAARLSGSELPVLLLAETGTGKELFAHAVHEASGRAKGPFVAVNCGALSGSLLETELFGHGPGAFTGASARGVDGKLAAAHGGTLFLDEVAEMSPEAQAMLLRFLEDGSFTRVGEVVPRRADVRLVCATCRDLPKLVTERAFRQDLFFRIQGGTVRLPPLRERTDRVELGHALLASLVARRDGSAATGKAQATGGASLSSSAEAWILDHAWPGNVRELKTALSFAMTLAGDVPIAREHFPDPLLVDAPARGSGASAPSRRAALRTLATEAMARAGGNVSEAARALGVARSTLYRMLGRA